MLTCLSFLRPLMIKTAQEVANSLEKHMVFAPACYDHGLVEGKYYHDLQIEGISAWQQFLSYMNSNGSDYPKLLSSTCPQVNCEETCKPIDSSSNSYC